MEQAQQNNPLHGKTLEMLLNELVNFYGWPQLAYLIRINCFANDPSIKSSLIFLRKTPWARKKVEDLYVETLDIRKKRGPGAGAQLSGRLRTRGEGKDD